MKHQMSNVTVCVPVFNEEKYLFQTLESIRCQTYKDFVCFISDDTSTDDSKKIARQFFERDGRFILFEQEKNKGGYFQFNFLVSKIG